MPRRRFIGAVMRVVQMGGIPLLVWFLQSKQLRETVRPTLVETLCPLLGVFLILTLFTQLVVEVVTDKELKMRYVQQIAGVSQVSYWCSYYLYFFVLTSFATALYLICIMSVAPIYKYSDPLLMYLVFTAAFLQTFFACMMVSTVFSGTRMAAVVCSMFGTLVVGVSTVLLPQISTTTFETYFLETNGYHCTPHPAFLCIQNPERQKAHVDVLPSGGSNIIMCDCLRVHIMYVCVYIYIYTHTYTCIYTHAHVRAGTYIKVCG